MSPLFVLIVAVLATTYAGPVIRLATARALAIAFWRLAMVLPVTAAGAARENRLTPGPWPGGSLKPRPGGSLNPRPGVGAAESSGSRSAAESGMPLVLMALSGLALAAHFWTWI